MKKRDEGYIKFRSEWVKKEIRIPNFNELNHWRDILYRLGIIGVFKDGIGFGNVSTRLHNTKQFIITGTETGKIKKLDEKHYSEVISFDFDRNFVKCEGMINASSESMTHAAIYSSDENANAVIHAHSPELWNKLRKTVPATAKDIAYGTPEMAYEVMRLFKDDHLKEKKIFLMLGHKDGIVAFGKDLYEAGNVILKYYMMIMHRKGNGINNG